MGILQAHTGVIECIRLIHLHTLKSLIITNYLCIARSSMTRLSCPLLAVFLNRSAMPTTWTQIDMTKLNYFCHSMLMEPIVSQSNFFSL